MVAVRRIGRSGMPGVPGAALVSLILVAGLAAPPHAGAGEELPPGRLVDLTHSFGEDTIYWPTAEGFVLEKGPAGVTEKGYYYSANAFRAAEHGGTHIDAPVHFHQGGDSVDEVPLERLIGEAALVDVSAQCAEDRDHQVQVDDLLADEAEHGRIPSGAIVLLRTGFGRFWPDPERYLGTAQRGAEAVADLRFPGLHPEAARWLVRERAVSAVGLDTASIDHGSSERFEAHQALFAHGVPAFENLARLDELPARGFHVVALPMKIRGGSGGPLRALAIVPDEDE